MGTLFVPSRALCLTFKAANGDICFFFLTERDWSWNSCYGNKIKGVILFLLWCTFVVPSFKNTALIFAEIFLYNQYFTIFCCKSWRHHWPNLHNRKMSISLKRKKDISKKETPFFCTSKCLSNKQKKISCHIHFKNSLFDDSPVYY